MRRSLAFGVLTLVLACSAPMSAWSQSIQGGTRGDPPCVLDKCLGLKPNDTGQRSQSQPSAPASPQSQSAVAPGAFDFYVLALSWSPSFCQQGGASKSPDQCAAQANPGFVVHGLWPQNQRGYPSGCDGGARFPSRLALDSARGVYPDEGLARHEWRQHGTCTGKSPTDYFADVRRARDAIVIPDAFKAPAQDQTWAPLDIARSFVAVNPRLRTDSMAVTCRQNALQEVRVCLGKDLRGFVPCPEVARASCRQPFSVPSSH